MDNKFLNKNTMVELKAESEETLIKESLDDDEFLEELDLLDGSDEDPTSSEPEADDTKESVSDDDDSEKDNEADSGDDKEESQADSSDDKEESKAGSSDDKEESKADGSDDKEESKADSGDDKDKDADSRDEKDGETDSDGDDDDTDSGDEMVEESDELPIISYIKNIFNLDKVKNERVRHFLEIYQEHFLKPTLVILGVLVAIGGIYLIQNRKMTKYTVEYTNVRSDTVSAKYVILGDGLLRYSKDGVSYSTASGETVWNQSYGMTQPKASQYSNYLAVGDIGANLICIFDEKGMTGRIDLEMSLADLIMAKNGVIGAILSDSQSNYINMYDKSGNVLVSIKASINNTGYPFSIALSSDGTRLAVSYVKMESGVVSSNITIYSFEGTTTTTENAILGSFDYSSIFPKLEFLKDGTLAAYGEDRFVVYDMKGTPKAKAEVTFENEIKSIFSSDDTIGFIFKNSDPKVKTKYVMKLYNQSGHLTRTKGFDYDYDYMSESENEVIFYSGNEVHIFNYQGIERFKGTFESDIVDIMSMGSKRYLVIDNNEISQIRVR